MATSEQWAKKPKPKVDAKPPQNNNNPADLIGKTRLMFDLIHLALQTDSTRLITMLLLGTSHVPPVPGVSMGHHDLSHHGQDPKKIEQLRLIEIEQDEDGPRSAREAEEDRGARRQRCSTARRCSSAAISATPATIRPRICRSCWPAAASSTASIWRSIRKNPPPLSQPVCVDAPANGHRGRPIRLQHRNADRPGTARVSVGATTHQPEALAKGNWGKP